VLKLDEEEHENEKEHPNDTIEHELPTRDEHHLSLNALKEGLG